MVTNPKKEHVYWMAGHRVYARDHLVLVQVTDVFENDDDVVCTLKLAGVPSEFRSLLTPDGDLVETIVANEDLFDTRRQAVETLAVKLMKAEMLLEVAKVGLRTQFKLAKQEEDEVEKARTDKPSIRQHR